MARFHGRGRGNSLAALLLLAAAALPPGAADANEAAGPESGRPIPRYVSLKADKVNVRGGPSRQHEVAWVFTRAGLPVEVTAESENWRRIRDSEGAEGWVYHSLLSGRRTVQVAPSAKEQTFSLYAAPNPGARLVAILEARVLATVRRCDGKWCRIQGAGFDGFMEQHRLWGVYPNEVIE